MLRLRIDEFVGHAVCVDPFLRLSLDSEEGYRIKRSEGSFWICARGSAKALIRKVRMKAT